MQLMMGVISCRVARIDKVTPPIMKVSWYRRHNGRCTLTRHGSGPDEGQIQSGDVDLTQHAPLAAFDRFTGNKEVPADVLAVAAFKLQTLAHCQTGQENATQR